MTFSPKPITSNPSRFWTTPFLVFLIVWLILWINGGTLGFSDDEAYYWVLAQKPALGYAYHPPAMAWMIWICMKLFGPLFGANSAWIVRLPSSLSVGAIFGIALQWLKRQGRNDLWSAAFLLISFAGFFSLGWMMVPDTPLYLGWMIAFYSTWVICFDQPRTRHFFYLGLGVALSILGKYSGVAVAFSSLVAVAYFSKQKSRGIVAVMTGTVIALIPILIWNSEHQWGSILYQIHERHAGAEVSLRRYFRFWAIELIVAGPLLIYGSFLGLFDRFFLIWLSPVALIYLIQPLFSDFKPHWAFAVWLIGAMFVIRERPKLSKALVRVQLLWGISLGLLVFFSLRYPLIAHFNSNPLMDVTNDLYGWSELKDFSFQDWPIVGSRYQTAAQAAAALGDFRHVTLLPKEERSRDEWPDLQVTENEISPIGKLLKPVYFVEDNRYTSPPEFTNARCREIYRIEKRRLGFMAKAISVLFCEPIL